MLTASQAERVESVNGEVAEGRHPDLTHWTRPAGPSPDSEGVMDWVRTAPLVRRRELKRCGQSMATVAPSITMSCPSKLVFDSAMVVLPVKTAEEAGGGLKVES